MAVERLTKADGSKMDCSVAPIVEEKSVPMQSALANKIADALGIPKTAKQVSIVFDWSKSIFEARCEYYLTDEDGQLILREINSDRSSQAGCWKRSDISDLAVCLAVEAYQRGAGGQRLMVDEELSERLPGCPPKVIWSALERCEDNGLIDCGTSLRGAWLTDKGREFVAAQKAQRSSP